MRSGIDNFTAYLPSIDRRGVKNSWTFNTSGSHKLVSNLTPLNFCLNVHGLSLITSPSKMTTILIRRNAPHDSCHNWTALMPRCTKTSFIITPHYICAHRNSDNLYNAAFIGYCLFGEWRMSTLLWSYISIENNGRHVSIQTGVHNNYHQMSISTLYHALLTNTNVSLWTCLNTVFVYSSMDWWVKLQVPLVKIWYWWSSHNKVV